MGLRDIFLLVTIYGSIPFIYMKPFIGVLVWYWLSLMNPHRISWTLINQPFAQIIALVMLSSLLIASNEKKRIPVTPITVLLGLFWLWMLITTIFSLYPQLAWHQWDKVWKIMLTTFVAIMVLNTKERLIALTFLSALSIGIYGFKGGIFTLTTGGGSRVWGPVGSFIGGNNEIGMALVMTIPLLVFMRNYIQYFWIKRALLVGIILCVFSIVGTQSRGAFLALIAMGLFLALKSSKSIQYVLLAVILGVAVFSFMPESWHERMGTISSYEEDASAMGRLKAWEMAFNMAMHRPFGGGYETFRPEAYLMYLPEVGGRRTDAHSIYFETLAEHGFVGLGLFLGIGLSALLAAGRIARSTKGIAGLEWANDLAKMLQVSLVGYAANGAFLGLAYFNFYYAILSLVVGLGVVVKGELAARDSAAEAQQSRSRSKRSFQESGSRVRDPAYGLPSVAGATSREREAGSAHAGMKPPNKQKGLPTVKETVALAKDWYARM